MRRTPASSVTDPLLNSTSYVYDTHGQRTETHDARSKVWYTSYDSYGNVTGHTDPLSHSSSISYSATANSVLGLPSSTSTATGLTESYTYNATGQRATLGRSGLSGSTAYTYNDAGQRTSKTDSTGTVASLFDGSRVVADSRADYTNGGVTGLVSERASGTTQYYHGDGLGFTRGLTNSSQPVTASRERDAWGNVVASSGTLAGLLGFVGGQGYQRDSDSGLMLLGARPIPRDTNRIGRSFPGLRNPPAAGSGEAAQARLYPLALRTPIVLRRSGAVRRTERRWVLSPLRRAGWWALRNDAPTSRRLASGPSDPYQQLRLLPGQLQFAGYR